MVSSLGLTFWPPKKAFPSDRGTPLFLKREVAFLHGDGTIAGVGMAWIPLSILGLRLIRRMFSLVGARKLLGEAINELYGGQYWIEILEFSQDSHAISPYTPDSEPATKTLKIIWIGEFDTKIDMLAIVSERLVPGLVDWINVENE